MKTKTKETIVKTLIIIGVILGILLCVFSVKYELFSPTEAELRKNQIMLRTIYILAVIDAIAIVILMRKLNKKSTFFKNSYIQAKINSDGTVHIGKKEKMQIVKIIIIFAVILIVFFLLMGYIAPRN